MKRLLYALTDRVREHGRRRQGLTLVQMAGRRGEDIAHRFLQRAGLVVVARNYRMQSGRGEIDIIAWDGPTLVFVEVKARETDAYGAPDRAIGREKLASLMRAAWEYARLADAPWDRVRFDVVSIVFAAPVTIEHHRDVLAPRAFSLPDSA